MAIRKSHYCVAGAYLLIFVLFGVYMAHERKLDKALNDSNKEAIPQVSGSTEMTGPQDTASTISTQTGTIPVDIPSAPSSPPSVHQNWKHAEFCADGAGIGSRVVVDGKTVESRSFDLRLVWYASGWDAKRVDDALDKMRRGGEGGYYLYCALTAANKAAL